jgi:hypothetical protein
LLAAEVSQVFTLQFVESHGHRGHDLRYFFKYSISALMKEAILTLVMTLRTAALKRKDR